MKYSDIQKKSDSELTELIMTAREELRTERFKDKFSKKAATIKSAKLTIAQALTEVTSRRNKVSK
jgi:ribosomal protein L29